MNTSHLFLLIILNMMDYFMFYLIGNKLINEKILPFTKKTGIKMIAFGLTYGILIGVFAYAVQYNNVDLYIFRIVATISLIYVSKTIAKKKLSDSFLFFTIIYLIIVSFQMPINLLLTAISLELFYISLLGQILSLFISILLFWKISLYYFYGLVEQNILMKLILYVAMCIALFLYFYTNYSYSITSIFYFLMLITLTIIGLVLVLVRVSFYTEQVSKNLHDTKNLLGGIHVTAHSTEDIHEIRKNLDACIELLQLQNSIKDSFEINQAKENIIFFIQQKKESLTNTIEIDTQITYIDAHEIIPLGMIIYMLGTLLDNAIEYVVQHQIKQKPILVELTVMDDTVEIQVSNPYDKEATEEFKKSFERGHSTKSSHKHGRDGRGHGLSNLKSVVRKYDGIIYYSSHYQPKYEQTYLTITIESSCYSSWKAQELQKSTNYGNRILFLVKMK